MTFSFHYTIIISLEDVYVHLFHILQVAFERWFILDTTDEEDAASSTMQLPETVEDFSPLLSSTMIVPEPVAKKAFEHDMEGYEAMEAQFHFGFKEDSSNESLPRFSID